MYNVSYSLSVNCFSEECSLSHYISCFEIPINLLTVSLICFLEIVMDHQLAEAVMGQIELILEEE